MIRSAGKTRIQFSCSGSVDRLVVILLCLAIVVSISPSVESQRKQGLLERIGDLFGDTIEV
ncbi:MAG: hypothetical protein MK102_08790 [Fuerstiella sp.]|nr:hypothetical protein [Fuerstiella sp.]